MQKNILKIYSIPILRLSQGTQIAKKIFKIHSIPEKIRGVLRKVPVTEDRRCANK